jgi:hypothetical protein
LVISLKKTNKIKQNKKIKKRGYFLFIVVVVLKWISCLRVPGEGGTGQVPEEGGTGHEPVGAGAAGLPGSHTEQKREEHPLLSHEKKTQNLRFSIKSIAEANACRYGGKFKTPKLINFKLNSLNQCC